MEKEFTSYKETIAYSKANKVDDKIYFLGSQLWERNIAWEYLKKEKIEKFQFTEYDGTKKWDLAYLHPDGKRRIVEIKFRYAKSTDYSSAICEKDKYYALQDLAKKFNGIPEYWNIFLDGVIKIYDLRYALATEGNVRRDASDSYHTQNKKKYSTFFLTEDNLYQKSFRGEITIDEINSFASRLLIKRGFEVPQGFKLNKK